MYDDSPVLDWPSDMADEDCALGLKPSVLRYLFCKGSILSFSSSSSTASSSSSAILPISLDSSIAYSGISAFGEEEEDPERPNSPSRPLEFAPPTRFESPDWSFSESGGDENLPELVVDALSAAGSSVRARAVGDGELFEEVDDSDRAFCQSFFPESRTR